MKKVLFCLLLFVSIFAKGQDIAPTDTAYHSLGTYSFKYYTKDSSVWIQKGPKYGTTKLDAARDPWYIKMLSGTDTIVQVIHKKDTLLLPVYRLKGDTTGLKGHFTNYMGSLKAPINNPSFTGTVTAPKLKLNGDTIHGFIKAEGETNAYAFSLGYLYQKLDAIKNEYSYAARDTTGNFVVDLADSVIVKRAYLFGHGTIKIGTTAGASDILLTQDVTTIKKIISLEAIIPRNLYFTTTGTISFKIWYTPFYEETILGGFDTGYNSGFY